MSECLGNLTAGDLGTVIRLQDGGATYEGTLHNVEHQMSSFGNRSPSTMLVLRAGEWRHIKVYPSTTPYETPATTEPTP